MEREDLKKFRDNDNWIKDQIERYKEQKQRAEDLKAVVIDGMPKAKDKGNYAIEDLIDKENDILKYWIKQLEKQDLIIKQLEKMENTKHRNILYDKYILGYSIEEISTNISYSYYEVCRQHGEALNEFDQLDDK